MADQPMTEEEEFELRRQFEEEEAGRPELPESLTPEQEAQLPQDIGSRIFRGVSEMVVPELPSMGGATAGGAILGSITGGPVGLVLGSMSGGVLGGMFAEDTGLRENPKTISEAIERRLFDAAFSVPLTFGGGAKLAAKWGAAKKAGGGMIARSMRGTERVTRLGKVPFLNVKLPFKSSEEIEVLARDILGDAMEIPVGSRQGKVADRLLTNIDVVQKPLYAFSKLTKRPIRNFDEYTQRLGEFKEAFWQRQIQPALDAYGYVNLSFPKLRSTLMQGIDAVDIDRDPGLLDKVEGIIRSNLQNLHTVKDVNARVQALNQKLKPVYDRLKTQDRSKILADSEGGFLLKEQDALRDALYSKLEEFEFAKGIKNDEAFWGTIKELEGKAISQKKHYDALKAKQHAEFLPGTERFMTGARQLVFGSPFGKAHLAGQAIRAGILPIGTPDFQVARAFRMLDLVPINYRLPGRGQKLLTAGADPSGIVYAGGTKDIPPALKKRILGVQSERGPVASANELTEMESSIPINRIADDPQLVAEIEEFRQQGMLANQQPYPGERFGPAQQPETMTSAVAEQITRARGIKQVVLEQGEVLLDPKNPNVGFSRPTKGEFRLEAIGAERSIPLDEATPARIHRLVERYKGEAAQTGGRNGIGISVSPDGQWMVFNLYRQVK